MEQKTIRRGYVWTRYLLLGNLLIITFLSACHKEYRVRADFIYINETGKLVELVEYSTKILPGDSTIIKFDTEGPEYVTEKNYVPQFTSITIRYDSMLCLFYDSFNGPDEGPVEINNYKSRKIAERYYAFVYRFTEDQFAKAEACQQ